MPKTSKARPTAAPKHFEARLERLRSGLGWIIVYVPFDAAKLWGLRGQIKVRGEINGFAFRTSLFPTGDGRHFLLVNKRMQKGARAFEGRVARFQMEFDNEKQIVAVPEEFTRVLRQDRSLRRWYEALSDSSRNEIVKWITDPKSAEARLRRAEQMAERLFSIMEAERELPPVLQVAFARHPRARDGWDHMTVKRRRGHLWGIFYYRNPETQARRIDKMLEDATAFAEKMSNKKK
jgi:uncharacterized protein YdeI (YjbR/CyaY-like superfamily)